ncbi:MAG: DUF6040 family protein [Agathobacter sp.]
MQEAKEKLEQSQQLKQQTEQREQDIQKREKLVQNTADKYRALVTKAEEERQDLSIKHKAFHSIVTKKALELSEQSRQKYRTEYLIKQGILSGYVAGLSLLLLLISALSLIRQKIFLSDLIQFGKALWNGIVALTCTVNVISLQATTITKQIPQPIVASIIWWIIRTGIPLASISILLTVITMLIKRYGTTIIKKGINHWNCSLSVVILTVFIFFGDYVKKFTEFNLIGMWLIADVILIGIAWYKCGCD